MTRTEEEQARDEAARTGEEIEQLIAGEPVSRAAGLGEFEQIQMPVAAPVDDVIAAVLFDLRLQSLARDAVRQEVGDDAAVGIDLLLTVAATRAAPAARPAVANHAPPQRRTALADIRPS